MHMNRVFVKVLSIAKCVLNAALTFVLVFSLKGIRGEDEAG